MPISKFTTDYSGRKKDVSIMRGTDPTSKFSQGVTLEFGKVSAYCAGIQKLIQQYMVLLLTAIGTQPAHPDFGTTFYTQIIKGNVSNKSDLIHKFNFANLTAIEKIKSYQQGKTDIPEDEQLDTALLDDVIFVSRDQVNLRITVKSNAGDEVEFLMPIPL